jgi:hypothetical protein
MPEVTRSQSVVNSSKRLPPGQLVIVAAPAGDLLAAAGQQLLRLQPVQARINAPFAKGECPARFGLDRLDDFVAVHGAPCQELEDEQFGHAVQKIWIGPAHNAATMPQSMRLCQPQTLRYCNSLFPDDK